MHGTDERCLLRTSCEIAFNATMPTPLLMVLRPKNDQWQWVVRESFTPSPSVWVDEYTDRHGNRCQRLTTPVGRFVLRSEAVVETLPRELPSADAGFVTIQELPDSILSYLLPSRYCESDRLAPLAWQVVGDARPGFEQVARISEWVGRNVAYRPGSSNVPISALEVERRGEGVCRDLAHLAVALCRALSIPARLVSGYLHGLEPMDLHAWFEAWVGDDWHTFDPTQRSPGDRRVVIAVGRDAADVPLFNQFGPQLIPDSIQVSVEELPQGISE